MLLLCPTYFEASTMFSLSEENALWHTVSIGPHTLPLGICGFGLAAAGAGTSFLLSEYQKKFGQLPERAFLLGLAGAYPGFEKTIGTALVGTRIHCYGIGAGNGSQFIPAEEMGWKQALACHGQGAQGDTLSLHASPQSPPCTIASVTAAAGSPQDLTERLTSMRDYATLEPACEEMEGYSVALACRLFKAPLTIIRGISNNAGNRNFSEWNIHGALEACAEALTLQLKEYNA